MPSVGRPPWYARLGPCLVALGHLPAWASYPLAIAVVALAVGARSASGLVINDDRAIFVFFLFVPTLAGLLGLGPGLVATAVAAAVINLGYTPDEATSDALWVFTPAYVLQGAATVAVLDIVRRREAHLVGARQRMTILADLGARLGATLDYDRAVSEVGDILIPSVADVCVLDVRRDGLIQRVAFGLPDPETQALCARLNATAPDSLPAPVSALGLGPLTPQLLVSVPLAGRGRSLGLLTCIKLRQTGRRFDEDDVRLIEVIGRRLALWLDACELFAEANAANEAKDNFLGMVSHETGTPLTIISAYANALMRHAEEEQRVMIEEIRRQSESLERIIANMLVLGRGDRSVELEPVLLQRLVPHVTRQFEETHGRAVTVKLPAQPLPPVEAHTTFVGQIVTNLLGNAHKYSPGDAPIEVGFAITPGMVEVHIRDHGAGIAIEDAARIFDPFVRGAANSPHVAGLGLGLAVCRLLVTAQGGEIEVRPAPGGGALFAFSLPLCQGAHELASEASELEPVVREAPHGPVLLAGEPMPAAAAPD